ncbi:nucleotidyltransferase family protein [Rhodothermus marinus]|uniref:nucleotidyltransferase domain-containing protein n=1 Tax=Rhodothermus marinus TaxID=29549 RepID=UPI00396E14E9
MSLASSLPPEARVLTLAARTCLDPPAAEQLRALLGRPLDHERLYHLALRHGVVALMYRNLLQAAPDAVPEPWRTRLETEARALAVHNLHQTQELLRLVDRLEAEGIPVIPFKGPALAALIYGDPAARVYVDIDLLVKRSDFWKARRVIESLGYRAHKQLGEAETEAYLDTQLGFEFIHESRDFVVELHWAFFYTIYDLPLDPEAIWARHRQVPFAGRTLRTMAPEDLLLYLAIHGNKHRWLKLTWVADVAELLRRCADLDGAAVLQQAHRLGTARVLAIGCTLAAELLGAPVPDVLQRGLSQRRAARRMAREVVTRWMFREDADVRAFWPMFWYHFRERERWRHRLGYLGHHLKLALAPTEKDRAFCRLPKQLTFLYPVIRPVRVLVERLHPGEAS